MAPGSLKGLQLVVPDIEAARTERTKVLLFCSPSNPTGAVYPPEAVEAIGRWAVDHGIWVVSDEIYEHLLYDGAIAPSMPVVVPELADRCVVVNGVAKTYAMTGWRVGWLIGPLDVVAAAANLQSHATSNVSNVAQAAALAAVTGDLSAAAMMREAFDVRRKTMVRMLNEIPGVECPTPLGAFYCFPSLQALLDKPLRGRTPATTSELAELILEEVGPFADLRKREPKRRVILVVPAGADNRSKSRPSLRKRRPRPHPIPRQYRARLDVAGLDCDRASRVG